MGSPIETWHKSPKSKSQVWEYMPVTLALGSLRQGDSKFEDSLGYIAKACLKKKKKQTKNQGQRYSSVVEP
jgi:hypothetical protein